MSFPIVQVDGLEFGYNRDVSVLENWNAEFKAGEMVAITGPSGTGKSTLLYILGLMLRPSQGRILIDGSDVSGFSDRRRSLLRADKFGFVFQDAALDATRTVLDNVLESSLYRGDSRSAMRPRAYELLEKFGVNLRASHRPGQVSGGQAQRIALCRGLLNTPRILLADEPTGNLDAISAAVVVDALVGHAERENVVIVATHDEALVGRCTRAIRL